MAHGRAAKKRKPIRVLIVVGGLLLAANIWIIAGVSQRTNKEPVLPLAIEELIPKPGDLVSPQSTIGVNLSNTLSGELELDDKVIPLDQLSVQPTEGIITFSPGPGKDIATLPQGQHTVTVVYWPRTSTQDQGSTSYSWTFKVGA
jgi:hypothetical protein